MPTLYLERLRARGASLVSFHVPIVGWVETPTTADAPE